MSEEKVWQCKTKPNYMKICKYTVYSQIVFSESFISSSFCAKYLKKWKIQPHRVVYSLWYVNAVALILCIAKFFTGIKGKHLTIT